LGAVKRVYTNMAVLDVLGDGFRVVDMAEGVTPETLQAATDAALVF
jgi:acyl CoA:acetate/3-ketoacid CoA transferase beta subunit